METLITTDICIFIGLILILTSLSVHKLMEKEEIKIKWLYILPCWCLFMLFLDVICSTMLISQNVKYLHLLTILYTLLIISVMFYGYLQLTLIFKNVFPKIYLSNGINIFHITPALISTALLIYNIPTHTFFEITSDFKFEAYLPFHFILLLGLLMLIFSMMYILMNSRKLDKHELFLGYFVSITPIVGLFTQKMVLGRPAFVPVIALNVIALYLMQLTKERKKDPLTNLLTLEEFKNIMDNLEKPNDFRLVLIDLKNISNIITKYGKSEADHMVKQFAKVARDSLSFDTTICRKYDDEFYVLFEQKTKEEVEEELLKLENSVKNLNMKISKNYAISYAYSISEFDIDKFKNVPDFLKYLDHLLYIKKNAV